jgi:hypothetical protein
MNFTPVEENMASKSVRHAHNVDITKPFVPPKPYASVLFEENGKLSNKLDSWPDGFFERDFTFPYLEARQIQQPPSMYIVPRRRIASVADMAPPLDLDVNTQIRTRPKPRLTHKAKKTCN